jgi:hypothetical protein
MAPSQVRAMRRATEYLSIDRVIDLLLHHDGRLARMHAANGDEYFVLPRGGRVRPADVRKIIFRSDVVASEDGLFAGDNQTWRRRHSPRPP